MIKATETRLAICHLSEVSSGYINLNHASLQGSKFNLDAQFLAQ